MTSQLNLENPFHVTSLEQASAVGNLIRERCKAAVQGRDDVIDLILVALFADGHVLLEDFPGSGKTTLAKALGESIIDDLPEDNIPSFRRIQFTPDLLPSDITGVTIFNTDTNSFHFRKGPIFAHVVLADEINRTSPKVQAALLEGMAEKQVTVDNETHKLDDLFFVIATQNPLDLMGTYPLPLAQHDRFLFKIRMHHLKADAELEVIRNWKRERPAVQISKATRSQVVEARQVIHQSVYIAPEIHVALVEIAGQLRNDARVIQGISTRALVLSLLAMQAKAMLTQRDYVLAEDLEYLLVPLFCHRLELIPGISDAALVVKECSQKAIENLSRSSLQRR